MRLRRIELLCLRVADGLASERDYAALKRAGIDPAEWEGLSTLIGKALIDPRVIEVCEPVCQHLDISTLDIGSALRDSQSIDLVRPVMNQIMPAESALPETSEERIDVAESAVEDVLQNAEHPLEPTVHEQEDFETNENAQPEQTEPSELQDSPPEMHDVDSVLVLTPDTAENLTEPEKDAVLNSFFNDESNTAALDAESTAAQTGEPAIIETAPPTVEHSDSTEEPLDENVDAQQLAALEEEFSLQQILGDPSPPDLLNDIFSQLSIDEQAEGSPELSLTKEDPAAEQLEQSEELAENNEAEAEESEEVYVLDFSDGPEITEEEVLDIETEMSLPLAVALSPTNTPNMLDVIMQQVEEIGVPVNRNHLRLVSEDESSYESELESNPAVMGGVHVEITDIESPVQINDSTISRTFLYGSVAAMAVAAAYLLAFLIQEPPGDGHLESTAQVAMTSNALKIVQIESDETFQIFQSDDQEPTIIFIEDSEGAE